MILRAAEIEEVGGRRPYDLGDRSISVDHFVTRVTTPDTPFGPHKHEQRELWFILEGRGVVLLDGVDHEAGPRDLVVIDPWVEHGLRTESQVLWICLG
jgi:mannose-6-phosphate isomerase-like protein (cupin superfamily)